MNGAIQYSAFKLIKTQTMISQVMLFENVFLPHDFITSLVIGLVMYPENPGLVKSEAPLHHMIPN